MKLVWCEKIIYHCSHTYVLYKYIFWVFHHHYRENSFFWSYLSVIKYKFYNRKVPIPKAKGHSGNCEKLVLQPSHWPHKALEKGHCHDISIVSTYYHRVIMYWVKKIGIMFSSLKKKPNKNVHYKLVGNIFDIYVEMTSFQWKTRKEMKSAVIVAPYIWEGYHKNLCLFLILKFIHTYLSQH